MKRMKIKYNEVKQFNKNSKKKRAAALFAAAGLALSGLLAACSPNASSGSGGVTNPSSTAVSEADSDAIQVVATIFPEYEWLREIIGENTDHVELTMLLDSGVDLHSYQPSVDDIIKISTCDMFVYIGGESDQWVSDALKESMNPDMVVINLLDVMGDMAKEEELVEGMEAHDHDHDHAEEEEHTHAEGEEHDHAEDEYHTHAEGEDHDHAEEEAHAHEESEADDHDHGTAYDEHVWLSLKNAGAIVNVLCENLSQLDPERAESYQANAAAYSAQLAELDAEYQTVVDAAANKTLLFGDRFPFRYLVDDYGLDYYAAFVGCSAETEASFETITFLSTKVDELKLPVVLAIEGPNHKIADTIVQNTTDKNQKILKMDSIQSITANDVENGVTYLSIMEKNLEVLKEALN